MADNLPILDLQEAEMEPSPGEHAERPMTLRLMPGDFALIESRDTARSTGFADLCTGMAELVSGSVGFLGQDWARLGYQETAMQRGRIGRVFANANWIHLLGIDDNILLPQRHHTNRPDSTLRDEAATLSMAFGLPGLPMGRPRDLSPADLARAACVRAFLGRPALLVLEHPLHTRFRDMMPALLNALAAARDRGAAAIWLTGSDAVWRDRSLPTTHRLRLTAAGLAQASLPSRIKAA
jgi:phospholipid/cholesterol/gamma-HCH transport system ATP-binding protein